jgi:hypothetical protein
LRRHTRYQLALGTLPRPALPQPFRSGCPDAPASPCIVGALGHSQRSQRCRVEGDRAVDVADRQKTWSSIPYLRVVQKNSTFCRSPRRRERMRRYGFLLAAL